MLIENRKQRKTEFVFLLAKLLGPLLIHLTLAVGDENNIAFFEARLSQTIQRRVQRRLKIGAAAGKVLGQVHHRFAFDLVAIARVHVEHLQRRFR